MQLERMGSNEYGKRLEKMHSHPLEKKKPRLLANNGLTVYSSVLDGFERRKNGLALPHWQLMDTSRTNSATESRELRPVTLPSFPLFSSVAKHGRNSRGDSAMTISHVTLIQQNHRSRESDLNVLQPPIKGIAQRFHVSESSVSVPRESESDGGLLELRWKETKDSLKQSIQKVDGNFKDSRRELEEFKKRVGQVDPQSYSSVLLATPSSDVFKGNVRSQHLSQVPEEPTLSSGVAFERSQANELGHNSSQRLPPVWKQKYAESLLRDNNIKDIEAKIEITKSQLAALNVTKKEGFWKCDGRYRDTFEDEERTVSAAFAPLSDEEEKEVDRALNGHDGFEVLASHAKSNIDITRTVIQCLKPGVWLNDDVINLYLELLKERELCEPEKFLKCHFFNTFFFNKLYKDAHCYNFKAVRRWTTQKKLGYNLLECKKIFVPIHKDIHWCLAIINVQEKKFLYLDSLKGCDREALRILAKYIKDEAQDKLNKILDVSTWDWDCPEDIPEQLNGCDCGMFMIKYADFHSRGDKLNFTQEHMEHFRRRTVLELLQLKAR